MEKGAPLPNLAVPGAFVEPKALTPREQERQVGLALTKKIRSLAPDAFGTVLLLDGQEREIVLAALEGYVGKDEAASE